MAVYGNATITNAGLNMIAQSQTGTDKLIFTRGALGNGVLPSGTDIATLTALINPIMSIGLSSIAIVGNQQVRVRFNYTSSDVPEEFYPYETGIFAKLGEDGDEQLYAYLYSRDVSEMSSSSVGDENIFDFDLTVGSTSNVSIELGTDIYLTKDQLQSLGSQYFVSATDVTNIIAGQGLGPTVVIKAALLADNGYILYGNGYIRQWGHVVGSGWDGGTITYPIAMTQAYSATVAGDGAGNSGYTGVWNVTNTGLRASFHRYDSWAGWYWSVDGYIAQS